MHTQLILTMCSIFCRVAQTRMAGDSQITDKNGTVGNSQITGQTQMSGDTQISHHAQMVKDSQLSDPIDQLSPCSARLTGGLINLESLADTANPRFTTVYRSWNYSYNPCVPFDLPKNNPHDNSVFGDSCVTVSLCKYKVVFEAAANKQYYYTLGAQAGAKFVLTHDGFNDTEVKIVFQGYRSFRHRKTYIKLVCDRNRTKADSGLFRIVTDKGREDLEAELHHACCCLDACPIQTTMSMLAVRLTSPVKLAGSKVTSTVVTAVFNHSDPQVSEQEKGIQAVSTQLLVVVGCIAAVLTLAGGVGWTCYRKKAHVRLYRKIPDNQQNTSDFKGLLPQPTTGANTWQLASINDLTEHGSIVTLKTGTGAPKSAYRDYEPERDRRKSIFMPILDDICIPQDSIKLGQRLGGGIFGDTNIGDWSGTTVAVKRITLSVHEDQHSDKNLENMQEDVKFLSRQRHRNIVSMLGICIEARHPYIISEYINGQCVKDFISLSGGHLTWPHRIKMLSQIADGMAYLHSTTPPILHRDLRCANVFITEKDVIKVADFGIVKMIQPLRSLCQAQECCCQGQYSACPPSISWTAPEVLENPSCDEDDGYVTTAADVYSYAIVMWELVYCEDPYDELNTPQEVLEHVFANGRPEMPNSNDFMPEYKVMMVRCWTENKANRPSFKQIAVRLKEVMNQARSFQKKLDNR